MIRTMVALAGAAFLFMPGLLEQFETPKIAWARVWGQGALAWGLIAGRAGQPRRWGWLDRAAVAWIAAETLTTLLSQAPRVSLLGETRQREGLLTSLALFGLYFAARDGFTSARRIRSALHVLLVLAAGVACYAIAQAAGFDPVQWQRSAVYTGGYVRPFATLGHPNLLGVWCAVAAAAAWALALAEGGVVRGARLGAAVLLGVVLVLTLSRAAWLGAIAGLLVATLLALRGPVKLTPRLALGALTAVALVAVVAAATGAWRLVGLRLGELLAGGGSGGSRLEIWRSALAAWQARPLAGQGPDLFEMMFPQFQTAAYWRLEWAGLPFHAHSIYLHAAATRGVLGWIAALGWTAALVVAARTALRRADARGAAAAACGMLAACAVAGAFGALGIAGALLVVIASAMLAAAAEVAPEAVASPEPAAPRRVRRKAPARGSAVAPQPRAGARVWAARIAGVLAGTTMFLWGFAELRASRAGAAARAFMTSAPARAASASGYAVTLAPRDDRLWRMRAESLLWLTTLPDAPLGTQAEAERAAGRAVELAPLRAENHVILARALAAREAQGDTTARVPAETQFRRALALAPMDGLTLIEYADHESFMGRPTPALEAARRAVTLYPGEGPMWAAEARAWLAAGVPDSARVSLERSLEAAWRDPVERAATERVLSGLRMPSGARPARP